VAHTPPIFVTGTPRSGASMTARILAGCGAFGGCARLGGRGRNTQENPHIHRFLSSCFTDMGRDVRGQYPLPEPSDLVKCKMGFAEAVRFHLKRSGYVEGPWMYKDPRMCLVWSFWTNSFPNAKWVIVRRRDEEIINSCQRTGYMDAFHDWGGWQWWVNQYKSRFKDIRLAASSRVREVWPGKFIDGDLGEVMQVVDWLGLEWKEPQVRCILKPASTKDT